MKSQEVVSCEESLQNETSRAIISIRFILMVFIVFIHSNGVTNYWDENGVEYFYDIPLIENTILLFFTQILSRCAVPLFFLISGYLFYSKNYSYSVLVKKKIKSLLIPFLLWPLLYLGLYVIKSHFLHEMNPYCGLNLPDWLAVFIGKYEWGKLPENPSLVFQFWYIRDLLLLFFISPILKKILDKETYLLLFFTILLWMQSSNFYQKNAHQGICFFVLGMYLSKKNFSIEDLHCIKLKNLLLILLVLCPYDLFLMMDGNKYSICHEFNVIVLSILMLKVGYWIQTKPKLFSKQEKLANYSFWMFALHQPILQPMIVHIYKLCILATCMYSGGGYIVMFFVTTISTVLFCLGTGFIIKKIFPRTFSFLIGGR